LHVAFSHKQAIVFAVRMEKRPMGIKTYWLCLVLLSLFLAGTAEAQNCGWSKIDHELGFDESGIRIFF